MILRNSIGWIVSSVLALTLSTPFVHAQPSPQDNYGAKQSMKNAGHDTKDAAQDAGHGVKQGTRKGYNKTRHGTKKAYYKTKHGTKRAVHHVEGKSDTPANNPPR